MAFSMATAVRYHFEISCAGKGVALYAGAHFKELLLKSAAFAQNNYEAALQEVMYKIDELMLNDKNVQEEILKLEYPD